MSEDEFSNQKLRHVTRRALQFMNQYSLTEFEFEEKSSERSLRLRRSDNDSSPPLLEGRSERLPGQVRAPTVGKLDWKKQESSLVDHGELIAEITKKTETVPIKAPQSGKLTETADEGYVQFGDVLAVIVTEGESEEDNDG